MRGVIVRAQHRIEALARALLDDTKESALAVGDDRLGFSRAAGWRAVQLGQAGLHPLQGARAAAARLAMLALKLEPAGGDQPFERVGLAAPRDDVARGNHRVGSRRGGTFP